LELDHSTQLFVDIDARLLLLPVRSLNSAYKWITCPHLLERFQRDAKRAGASANFDLPTVESGKAQTNEEDQLFLEERQFAVSGIPDKAVVEAIRTLIPHDSAQRRLSSQLAVLHDNDFAWFARYGLAVNARNLLTDQKTSKNLWYEESLPPDSLFYAVLSDRNSDSAAVDNLTPVIGSHFYLQAGGNETVGMGWFAMQAAQPNGGAQ
jgi:CRISPR-associated protein Cmr4